MEFEERLSFIFLKFIKQTIDFKEFIDDVIKLIDKQREKGVWEDFTNYVIKEQNSMFLKIVHIYSITIFETFNREFFDELNKEKNLSATHHFNASRYSLTLLFGTRTLTNADSSPNFNLRPKTDSCPKLPVTQNSYLHI